MEGIFTALCLTTKPMHLHQAHDVLVVFAAPPSFEKAVKLFLDMKLFLDVHWGEHQDARAVPTLSCQLVAFIALCCWRAKLR